MKKSRKIGNGIFVDLGCAFFDRIDVSLYGELQPRPWLHLTEKENLPCMGKNSYYGRCSRGEFTKTGNPYELKYSKTTGLPRVPQAKLRLDSERSPLTAAEVMLAIRSLTTDPEAVRVSYAELTFDLHRDYNELRGGIVSAISKRRFEISNRETGLRTLYLGGRKSERYVCLYEKPPAVAPDVVRLEIRLNLRGLQRLGVVHPEDLLLLHGVDFSRLVSFCKLHVSKSHVPERWRRNLWRYCSRHQALDELTRDFVSYYPVRPTVLLRPIAADVRIREMQRALVY